MRLPAGIAPIAQPKDNMLIEDLKAIQERRDYLPMICGIKAFTSALRAYFRELGFDRKAMKVEWFD